jgi:hypothetical protein
MSGKLCKQGVACAILAALLASAAESAELKPGSLETFQRYIRASEGRMEKEQREEQGFLYVDRLPAAQREAAMAQLKNGKVYLARLETSENGRPIEDSDSLIHHWVGVVFIPGAKVAGVLEVVQDYNRHAEIYRPEVARSEITGQEGNSYRTRVVFVKKKVITVVLDTDHEIVYTPLDARRVSSRTRTTRVQQVEEFGKPGQKLLPVGRDGGFLWALNTYWRFQERDSGVYVQCETITLTRDLPPIIGPLIRGFTESIPRESLAFTLETTRAAASRSK